MGKSKKSAGRKKESGVALVAVLCTVLVVSLLVASTVAISQYSAFETATFTGISRSFYISEGVANRVRWLLEADRRQYSNRKLEQSDSDVWGNGERFLANGAPHQVDYYGREVSFTIEDAVAGVNISMVSPESSVRDYFSGITGDENDFEFTKFCSRLHDYTDGDDLLSVNGLEKDGYQSEYELYNLPRNGKMQFAQEIMYIPGFTDYFKPDRYGRPALFRLIPPEKTSPLNGRPSLFSSPLEMIEEKCKLSEEELERLTEILKDWRTENGVFDNTVGPDLRSRLLLHFSIVESGAYTVIVNTAAKNVPGTTLICSFRCNPRSKEVLQYYQFTFY